jgi:calmodulin
VDAKELGLLMASLGQEKKEEDLKKMLDEVDADGSGEIDVEEFLVLMVNYVGPQGEAKDEEIEEAFRLMDADGGGTIDKDELGTCLKDLGEEMAVDEIAQCIALVDTQGTGEISLPDFKAACVRRQAGRERRCEDHAHAQVQELDYNAYHQGANWSRV